MLEGHVQKHVLPYVHGGQTQLCHVLHPGHGLTRRAIDEVVEPADPLPQEFLDLVGETHLEMVGDPLFQFWIAFDGIQDLTFVKFTIVLDFFGFDMAHNFFC